jgi:ectoine hydroxylase-related dioxygenase (phytanoyl-CoA dioxygenase family)
MVGVAPELITHEKLEFFKRNGYLYYGSILTGKELQSLQQEIQRLIELRNPNFYRTDLGGKGDTSVGNENFLQMTGLWKISDVIRKITLDRKRAQIAAALLGVERVRLLSDMVLSKPGKGSRPTYWHQDYTEHPTSLPDVTAWIALDPTTLANGCMQYLPGSHTWGELLDYDYGDGSNVINKGIDTSGAVAVEMEPGEVTFHHSLVIHYAGPNTTERPRRAYITRYMPSETVYRYRKSRDNAERNGLPFDETEFPVLC